MKAETSYAPAEWPEATIFSAKKKRALFIVLLILPTFLFYCLFTFYPIVKGLYLSLFDWSGGSEHMNFIGLDNFRDMLEDPIVWKAVKNDYFLVFWKVIGIMGMAAFFAAALTRFKFKRTTFFRVVFFFPNVISIVVIGVLWRYVYNPEYGFLNSFASLFGGAPVHTAWLGDKSYAMWALLPPSIWAGIGFYMILMIAGILNIPPSLYEAAEMDGATQWQQFRQITIPLTWEQIKISILHIVMTTLNGSFVIVAIMTAGGPDNATQVMGYYLYQMGFQQYHLSYAAAIGVLILVVSLVTTLALQRILRRETIEIV